MILLCEYSEPKISKSKNGIVLEGIFMRSNFQNANSRWYDKSLLEREVGNIQSKIKNGNLMGSFGHPSDLHGDPTRISHIVESLTFKGDDVYGRARVVEGTPCGNIVKNLLEHGATLGFSSRGWGTTTKGKDGIERVNEDFRLANLDIVPDPSTGEFARALKESILTESYSPEEKEIALKILAEDNQHETLLDRTLQFLAENNLGMPALDKLGHGLSDLQRKMEYAPMDDIYRGHAAMPSLGDDKTSHYDRMWAQTLDIISKLVGLEGDMESADSSHADNEGFSTVRRKYMDVAGKAYDGNVEDVIRHMLRQPRMKEQLLRFQQQQELKRKARRDTLNRIFKGKV